MKCLATTTRAINRFKSLKQDFIDIHGDKYNYSKFRYERATEKSTIICPEHGDFQMSANKHLNGRGCPECGIARCGQYLKKDTKQVIAEIKETHGDLYDTSLVDYTGAHIDITLICEEHGKFSEEARYIIGGKGCPECAIEESIRKRTSTLGFFIHQANQVHDKYYGYNKAVYVNARTKLIITCPTCGDFEQDPNHHLDGRGCPSCSNWAGSLRPSLLYYLSINNGEAYKIGITSQSNVLNRYRYPDTEKITILKTWKFKLGKNAFIREQKILKQFKKFKYTGEDLLLSGNSELFNRDILGLDRLT